MNDYDSTIGVIYIAKTLKKIAILIFLIPGIWILSGYLFSIDKQIVKLIGTILVIPSYIIFMKLRVPTPRIKWENDFRGPLLVLRSFTDERLKTGELTYSDIGISEQNNFIWQAALALWDIGRVVMIKREKDTVSPIFGIVVDSDDSKWLADVEHAAKGAWAILLFPSTTEGVIKEMELLKNKKLLHKTVIFMPPAPSKKLTFLFPFKHFVNYKKKWTELKKELETNNITLPDYVEEGMLYIPNEKYGIARKILLNYNDYPWRTIAKMIDPTTPYSEALIDCIPEKRSYEL